MSRLWVERDNDIPLLHVRWMLRGGSSSEARTEEGLTNFAFESARRGSPDRDRRQTARYLAGVSSNLQIQVTPEHAQISAMVPPDQGVKFAHRLIDVFGSAAPSDSQLEGLRRELAEGYDVSLENPSSRVALLFRRLVFASDPWGNIPTGTKETLKNMESIHLASRLQTVIGGSRSLALGGDVDESTECEMAALLVGGNDIARSKQPWPTTERPRLGLWHDAQQQQATVMVGWLSEPWSLEMFVLGRMVEKICCGEFTSYLCQDFRQRAGLTYGIYGNHAIGSRGAWFRLRFGTSSEYGPRFLGELMRALEVFGEGAGSYTVTGQGGASLTREVALDADTVASCRTRTLKSLPFRFHTPQARLARRLEHELYGAPKPDFESWSAIVASATPDTLTRLARQLFANRRPYVAIVDNMDVNGAAYRELVPGLVLTEGDAGLCGQTSSV